MSPLTTSHARFRDRRHRGHGNISIGHVTIAEGNAGTSIATFTVTRTGGNAAFDLTYATADGTATAGSDYVAQSTGSVSFAAGDLTKTISVTINGDTTVEHDETFFVNLLNATGGGTIVDAQEPGHQGTIANDDTPGASATSISDVTITRATPEPRSPPSRSAATPAAQPFPCANYHREQHGNGRHQRRRLRGGLRHAQLRCRYLDADGVGDDPRRHDL
jgi:hypothetical protein